MRKFNSDLPKEVYESELERMNAGMMAENQSLQHDNKQLNTLIKEYEQTLDTLMSKYLASSFNLEDLYCFIVGTFRNRAQTVQENELSLIRHYESNLLQLEEENSSKELEASTRISESISRMSEVLRNCLREVGGERTSKHDTEDGDSEEDLDLLEREPWQSTDAAHAEWALEREIELARLERENEELKALIKAGQTVPTQATALPSLPRPQPQPKPAGEIGIGTEAEIEGEENKRAEYAGGESEIKGSDEPELEPQSQKHIVESETIPEDDLTIVDPYATVKRSNTAG